MSSALRGMGRQNKKVGEEFTALKIGRGTIMQESWDDKGK